MTRTRQTTTFVLGVALMVLGGIFLIAQLLGGNFWAHFWPYPIIGIGLAFLSAMVNRGRGAGGLAIPGTIITTLGLVLFLQNSFGWWESWAFTWTFLVIAVGVGLWIMGYWNGKTKPQRVGIMIAGIGTALLFLFGTFFGLGFSFLGFGFAARVIWPLMIIGAGAFFALRGLLSLTQNSQQVAEPPALPETPAAPRGEQASQNSRQTNVSTPSVVL